MIGYRLRVHARLPRAPGRGGRAARLLARPAEKVARLLRRADIEATPGAWLMRAAVWPAAAGAMGLLLLSAAGLVAGVVVGSGAPFWILRRRTRRRARRLSDQLPSALDAVAAAVRAGLSVAQALCEVASESPQPVRGALEAATTAIDVGQPFEEALRSFVRVAAVDAASNVATALVIGHRSGGDLPRVLEALAESMRERGRLEQQLQAGTAQARLSAWVVAGMPVAFLVLTGATSRAQADLLLRTPVGWGLLGVGGALEATGLLWMRRLVRA